MGNIETPNISTEQVEETIDVEIEGLKTEQENLDFDDKSNEELLEEQEKINLRIKELEEQKKIQVDNIKLFMDKAVSIVESGDTVSQQVEAMNNQKLFDLLPENTLKLIKENLEKYNFIDYKAAEIALEDESLDKELEELTKKKDLLDEKIEEPVDSPEIITDKIEENEVFSDDVDNIDTLEGNDVVTDNNFDSDSLRDVA